MALHDRLVHIHIPKTAGTALRTAIQQTKTDRFRLFPHYDERAYDGVDLSSYNFFSGHFGYETACRLGGAIITVLRDPIDRFVSVYYFWRQLHEMGVERNRKTALAVNYSLHEFAQLLDVPVLIEEFYNRATLQLAYGSSMQHRQALRDRGITDSQLLAQACGNLASFSAVGFQDDMGSFNSVVSTMIGLDVNIRRVNVTKERADTVDVEPRTIRLIENWVGLDMELMKTARRMHSSADDTGRAGV